MTSDILIVGGGPAGLAAALYAARAGLEPTVLEPRSGVIDKACGEGLMPGGLRALADLGVQPPGRDLLGIRYLRDHHLAQADFRDDAGRGVRRLELHAHLLRAVAAAGITVLPLWATALTQRERGVELHTSGSAGRPGPLVRGRYVIAADGLHSPMRRRLGLSAPAHGPRRYGLRRHFAVSPWSEHVEVHWSDHAEAYVTPVSEQLVGVAVLTSRQVPFAQTLAEFALLNERLANGTPATSVRGAGPLRQRTRARVAGRVLLVGDASGYVDALTGEGLSLAMAQARAAILAIAADRPRDYERDWRRVSRSYAVMTHLLVQTTRPLWLRRLVVPAAAALPMVFAAAVNELARPAHQS